MHGSNMGILPYWLIIWLITAVTTLLIQLSSQYYHKSTALVTSVIRLSSQYYHKGPKRVCCTAQLKHRCPLSTAHNITWGLGRIRTIATPLDRRKATREITWGPKRVLQKHNSNIGTHWAQLKILLGDSLLRNEQRIYTCNRLSSHGLEAWCIHLKPRVSLPF